LKKYNILATNGISVVLLIVWVCIFGGCKSHLSDRQQIINTSISEAISTVSNKYAPDTRTVIYEIDTRHIGDRWVLKGNTNMPDAKNELLGILRGQGISVIDSIEVLPLHPDYSYARVNVSVANLRVKPSHAAELVTQTILGFPLRVFEKSGGWYRVQTPDSYIAWVNEGAIIPLSKRESDSIVHLSKIIYQDTYGFAHETPSPKSGIISDLTAGAIFDYIDDNNNYYQVGYPDGRKAWIPKSSGKRYSDWKNLLKQGEDDLVNTALSLNGIPYLWGGTSVKAMDCSGFTKTVYLLNGFVIPRDASQQSRVGVLIDSLRDFEKLRPGDLLFFGKKATETDDEKVIHVGLWIGNGRFIHASGSVHISSLIPEAIDFDKYNYSRYLKAKRLLNFNDKWVINLKTSDIFKVTD